eukprot:TRINITY_DN3713_c0_g3_i1.p1 TRINITY_DN3713_c0_g3~~TRINITY_DN3713_c0_g3_i1.p1  ORF type:complete len:662 (+),score=96.95 TRINITY_DN3713_c0_g3_i1:65-2050(+)
MAAMCRYKTDFVPREMEPDQAEDSDSTALPSLLAGRMRRCKTDSVKPTGSLSPDFFKPLPKSSMGLASLSSSVHMAGLMGACGEAVSARTIWQMFCSFLRAMFFEILSLFGFMTWGQCMRKHMAEEFGLEPPQFSVKSIDCDTCLLAVGGVLRATLHLPREAEGPFPVVIMRTPYGRSSELGQTLLAERGFAVLVQDTQGRFGSGGDFVPIQDERADGAATIEWVLKQSWCNGRIGVMGASYLGFTAWAALGSAGPKIDAGFIIISQSRVKRAVLQQNGAISFELCLLWLYLVTHLLGGGSGFEFFRRLFMGAWRQTLRKGMLHLPLCNLDELCLGKQLPLWQDGVLSFDDPSCPFWDNKDVLCDVTESGPPLQLLSGWHDVFLEQNLEDFQRAGRRASLTVLPCSHWSIFSYEHLMSKITFELFQEHLQGKVVKNPARPRPRVQVGLFDCESIIGFDDWPPPSTAKLFHLAEGGSLSPLSLMSPWQCSYTYDPADPTPASGGPSFNIMNTGEKDQASIEARTDVLIFTSEPMTEAMVIAGKVEVDLEVEVGSVSADFVARLCAVSPTGISMNRCEGLTRVTGPGRHRVHVDLGSCCALFRPGHSIRLHVCSGAHPRWLRNLQTGEPVSNAVRMVAAKHLVMSGSTLTLPTIPSSLVEQAS